MSSSPALKQRPSFNPKSRPVVAMPTLSVVPSPAPRKGFLATIFLCAAIFFGALLLSFYLNTRMVQGAYDIKDIKVEIAAIQIHEEALEAQALAPTSPAALKAKAAAYGMVPSGTLREVNLESGTLSAQATE